MIKYRHFIKLQEILKHYDVQNIDDSRYHFSPKVLQQLKDLLISLEHKYKQAEQELFFLKFVDEDFFHRSTNESQLVQLLAKVYLLGLDKVNEEKILRKDKNKDNNILEENFLENVLSNLSEFMLFIIEGFIIYYNKLLLGKLKLQDPGKEIKTSEFLKDWIFSKDLIKLQEHINELNTLQSIGGTLTVTYKVYDHFNNTGKTEIEKEEKLCNVYKKIISAFYHLSEKIATILYNHFVAQNLKGQDMLSAVQLQDIPIEDLTDEPKILPFAIHTIEENKLLKGRLVIEVINEMMVFCINICQLFKYHPLHVRYLNRQKHLDVSEEFINLKSKIE